MSDQSLYGIPRPKSSHSKAISSSTTLAFTSTLSSLIQKPSSSTGPSSTAARPKSGWGSKASKSDLFTTHNKGLAKRAARDLEDSPASKKRKSGDGDAPLDPAAWHSARLNMEEKARKYAAMKRGDYLGRRGDDDNALVDFDRKWAEKEEAGEAASSSSDDDDGPQELVEYEDEMGRTRTGTRAEADREARRRRVQQVLREDDDSARPAQPERLIYGDTIQAAAFAPADEMEALAAKRDRSATPPEEVHYDASREVRSKGVGFYSFSKDKAVREREMEALEAERKETEKGRQERERRKEERAKMVEERRKLIREKRGKREAEQFLEGLGDLGDVGVGSGNAEDSKE